MRKNKAFRVFVTRHYIAVEWYDIKAPTPARARRMAERTARGLVPDARAVATDNHWHADDPTDIPFVGSAACGKMRMKRIAKGVYRARDVRAGSVAP